MSTSNKDYDDDDDDDDCQVPRIHVYDILSIVTTLTSVIRANIDYVVDVTPPYSNNETVHPSVVLLTFPCCNACMFGTMLVVMNVFYVEVFVENACVCIRLIGPTYVVVLFI